MRRGSAALVRVASTLALLSAGAGASACSRTADRDLTIAGSTSVQPYAEAWADAYRDAHPGVVIQIQGGGSTAGVRAVTSGAAQIGMVSRSLTADEAARVRSVAVARDGIAIVVHPSNSVGALALADVRAIYAGRLRSWRQLGGRDERITSITREDGSGTRAAFESSVMGGERIAASALVQDSTGAVRQMVASDPAAVGYVSMGLVDASVRAVRLDGIAPGETTIDAGTYPLVRPFLFVLAPAPATRGARAGGDTRDAAARDFVAWVIGPAGRELARREGLLPPRASPDRGAP